MALYVTLSEGPRADLARPILGLSERRVINALLQEIGHLRDRHEQPNAQKKAALRDTQMSTKNSQTQDHQQVLV